VSVLPHEFEIALAYWTDVCLPRAQGCLVEGLRKTQTGRLSWLGQPPAGTLPTDVNIREGISALMEGRTSGASTRFLDANRRNSQLASASFIALWAEQARQYKVSKSPSSGGITIDATSIRPHCT
jgi:hypothetical protein